MELDVKEFLDTCPTCAQNKSFPQPPAGFLLPLPVPAHPWSDISLDFVTVLPPSDGNTTFLTVVDSFSKMAHFIPILKLPTAKETAEPVLVHVIKIPGIPRDIVSDWGLPFTSQFWNTFCTLLGTSASLTSGHQPQSNGQTKRLNQELENGLQCLASKSPTSWSKQ